MHGGAGPAAARVRDAAEDLAERMREADVRDEAAPEERADPAARSCTCGSALQYALITRPEAIPAQAKKDLAPLIGKYLS